MRLKDRKALIALVLVLINGFRISAQDTIPNTTIAVQDSVIAKADNKT